MHFTEPWLVGYCSSFQPFAVNGFGKVFCNYSARRSGFFSWCATCSSEMWSFGLRRRRIKWWHTVVFDSLNPLYGVERNKWRKERRREKNQIKWMMDAWRREQSEEETWRKMGLMREGTEYRISRLIRRYMWWDSPCNYQSIGSGFLNILNLNHYGQVWQSGRCFQTQRNTFLQNGEGLLYIGKIGSGI